MLNWLVGAFSVIIVKSSRTFVSSSSGEVQAAAHFIARALGQGTISSKLNS